jgi:hypothetical protein
VDSGANAAHRIRLQGSPERDPGRSGRPE